MLGKLSFFLLAALSVTGGTPGAAASMLDDGGDGRFFGIVQSLPAGGLVGTWQIGGAMVAVTFSTELRQDKGVLAVGACVEVRGSFQTGGIFVASEIRSDSADNCPAVPNPPGNPGNPGNPGQNPTRFAGSVQTLPAAGTLGDWMVNGTTVHVTAATRLRQDRGPISVGSFSAVIAFPDGRSLMPSRSHARSRNQEKCSSARAAWRG